MSNYQSHILPTLQDLSSSTSESIRVAYVTAESVGKSTRLVPDLWNHVKATRADAQGLYILFDQEEIKVTSYNIRYREDTDITNGIPSIENARKLGLISYESFNTLMEDTADPSTLLRHQDMILFIDVEHIPTVDGELSIGIVVDWIRGLKKLQEVNLTVVLLGGKIREDIGNILHFYDIHPFHLVWEEERKYKQETLEDTDKVIEVIRLSLFESPQCGLAPYVVICTPIAEAYDIFIKPINNITGRNIRCLSIGRDSNMENITRSIIQSEPTVIFLEENLSSYVSIPNLRCVISIDHKRTRIFDPSTSQFPIAAIPISEGDIFRQKAWVGKGDRADSERPTFYTSWDDEWLQNNKSKDDTHIESDSAHLLLAVSKIFKCLAYPEVPVPALNGSLSVLREVRRRLVILGCLADDAPTSQITPLGIRTLYYIKHKTFNGLGNFHVAYLLARIENDTTLSIPSKRVLIRMVALSIYRNDNNLYTFTEEAAQSLKEDDGLAFDVITEDCAGIGKQNSHYGQLWCELGILDKMNVENSVGHALFGGKTIIERGKGSMRVKAAVLLKVQIYIRGLETLFGIEPSKNLIEETMLNQDEIRDVFHILALTYLFQMVFFKKWFSTSFTTASPYDMISLQPVRLELEPTLGELTPHMATGDQENGGVFAIYQESFIYNEKFSPVYLTILPVGTLQRIVDSFGAPNLWALVSTQYPVPTA
ncbi:hypothetical protein GL218_09204 [Daldinia childiae]|uniref:uncharacterized protein n=1 Tax=Daldinia childiae TaxID=326645 RepID=UPI001445F971|nr:uncharacterized protein GL218_09204 [Daldinia childiae]KAF3066403.1 hypothetical protein GL218_09204 [Daldinia childiae]